MASTARFDVVAIGNAIVDIIAEADDAFLAAEGLTKGSMRLIDAEEADPALRHMGPAREISGGSAGNTAGRASPRWAAVRASSARSPTTSSASSSRTTSRRRRRFITPPADGGAPTARCLILVTPDGQRTMNTFLGAAQYLPATRSTRRRSPSAAILYLEGYLWDPREPRAAMGKRDRRRPRRRPQGRLHPVRQPSASTAIATISAQLIDERPDRHLVRQRGRDLGAGRRGDFDAAIAEAARRKVPLLVVTRSEHGAIAVPSGERAEVPAEPIDAGGRHHRRRRPVRRRLPVGPCPGTLARRLPEHRRGVRA